MNYFSQHLLAGALQRDERIAKSKELFLEALAEHRNNIQGVRPALPHLKQEYGKLIADFSSSRGGDLYYPYIGSGIGKGALVELLDGSVKYDFITGIGVHFFGHSHPALCAASLDAAISDTVMEGNLQQNWDTVTLTNLLRKNSGLDCVFLSSSGAMANENGFKMAFQKRFPAKRILTFEHAFAGRTLAMSQVTDKAAYRQNLPETLLVDYVPFFDPEHPKESTQAAVEALQKHLKRHPSDYALMIFELIQGERGFYVGQREFFIALMNILKEHQIAVFVDEVQSFGRTPALFAFQHFGLEEYVDIVTIGKMSQVCATLFRSAYKPKAGLISQTFTSSAAAIKTSIVILNTLIEGSYYGPGGRINQIHERFLEHFHRLEKKNPSKISGPYGIGAMVAFTPFGGDDEKVKKFAQDLFNAGVITFIAGQNPTRIRLLVPAGAITDQEIDAAMHIVETIINLSP